MTTYQIRNAIHVYSYNSHSEGCAIYYVFNGISKSIFMNNITLIKELQSLGSVDSDEEYADYTLSQWDALNVAIRHEFKIAIENEINTSDIGKVINNFSE